MLGKTKSSIPTRPDDYLKSLRHPDGPERGHSGLRVVLFSLAARLVFLVDLAGVGGAAIPSTGKGLPGPARGRRTRPGRACSRSRSTTAGPTTRASASNSRYSLGAAGRLPGGVRGGHPARRVARAVADALPGPQPLHPGPEADLAAGLDAALPLHGQGLGVGGGPGGVHGVAVADPRQHRVRRRRHQAGLPQRGRACSSSPGRGSSSA